MTPETPCMGNTGRCIALPSIRCASRWPLRRDNNSWSKMISSDAIDDVLRRFGLADAPGFPSDLLKEGASSARSIDDNYIFKRSDVETSIDFGVSTYDNLVVIGGV